MTLYGSLFSGVSGLNAQGSAIAMIADNISNINTDGYKGGEANFQTLVTSSGSSTSYASGGVTAKNSSTIDKQGLLKTTNNATDLAISGRGFFVVNSREDLNGDYVYTRAGSFGRDSRGNFRNTSGYYLLAWPLDSEGRLPGEPGNLDTTSSALLDSLQIVNLKSVSGTASSTTTVEMGLNLTSSQEILKGNGEIIKFPTTSPNYQINAKNVIVPDNSGNAANQDGFNIGDVLTLTPSNPGTAYSFTYGGLAFSGDITGTILGANTENLVFTAATTNDNFTITTPDAGTVTFTFVSTSPTPSRGEFNTLATLQDAIDRTTGLNARISGGRLYIAPDDAKNAMTFTDVTGTFVASLGFVDTVATPAVNRFATLDGLATLIEDQPGLEAAILNPLSDSSLDFWATDPLGTLTLNATGNAAVSPNTNASNAASVLTQLGLTPVDGTVKASAYSATDVTKNMASGNVLPHFSRNVRMFDAFGTGHDFRVSFAKIDDNIWSVEIYAIDVSEIVTSRTDGQIAAGNIEFNGDGTLRNVGSSLSIPIEIIWENEALPSSVTFNWGTAGQVSGTAGAVSIGKTDGLRQLDSDYVVDFVDQNGIASGLLNGVQITDEGFVVAQFSNGTSRKIFRIALADFINENGLESRAGNVYAETTDSGNFNLKVPDSGGVGKINPGALEQANVELADELTRMIVAQRGYQASSKVIKTVNEMLEELNRVI